MSLPHLSNRLHEVNSGVDADSYETNSESSVSPLSDVVQSARLSHPCAWHRPSRRLHPVARRTFRDDIRNIAFGASVAAIVWWLVS